MAALMCVTVLQPRTPRHGNARVHTHACTRAHTHTTDRDLAATEPFVFAEFSILSQILISKNNHFPPTVPRPQPLPLSSICGRIQTYSTVKLTPTHTYTNVES